jgi:hypothetical protein
MVGFGRVVAAFCLMVAVGYLAVVALMPAPPETGWRPVDISGPSAADRLSKEAQALVSRKPSDTLR